MRRGARLGVAVVVVLLTSTLFATPAHAHNYVVSTSPGADTTVTGLPERFAVTTNAPLLDAIGDGGGFALLVTDADGRFYGDGCIEVDGPTLATGATLGEPGPYTVQWRLVSEDGHAVSGEFGFDWQPADPGQATPGLTSPPDCGGANEPTAPSAEEPTVPRGNALPADVLWVGGAVLAVLVAGLVTVLLVGRRR